MKFIEIYNRTISLWGDKVRFNDAELINNGMTSKILSIQWNSIENIIKENDNYEELMIWTMYQVFHTKARTLFLNEIFEFDPKTIDIKEIEIQYLKNLNTEGWENELAHYEGLA